ncbi:Asp23/Gls24 family envelope stress response protein [Arthrobacter sp. Ld5]|uniref:Asp23/Gls24 family envelope stress response protein n=1 Tax=Arthrobacter sp. Ld5 TaxID=649152 RepID=UPI003EC02A39
MATITPTSGVMPAPHRRGTLTMSEKVVQKLAAQGASELPFVGGLRGGVLGVGRHADAEQRPQASVEISGTTVAVFLDVAFDFPTDLAARSADIRRHVTATLERATGLQVRRIDITVKPLTPTTDRRDRSLR